VEIGEVETTLVGSFDLSNTHLQREVGLVRCDGGWSKKTQGESLLYLKPHRLFDFNIQLCISFMNWGNLRADSRHVNREGDSVS